MLKNFKSDRLETKQEQFGLLFFYSYQLKLILLYGNITITLIKLYLILLYGKWRAIQLTPVEVSETSNIATSNLVGRRYLLSKIHISEYFPCNSM